MKSAKPTTSNYLLEQVNMDELINAIKNTAKMNNEDEGTRLSTGPVSAEELSQWMKQASEQAEQIYNEVKNTGKVPIQKIKKQILPVIESASASTLIFELLHQIKEKDEYTYWHTISVGVISSIIGRWLKLSKADQRNLMLSAVLHDIGKTKIPVDILNKPGKLTEAEYKIMKKHTIFGYELLTSVEELPDCVAQVAIQHHEREDGKGYPFGLNGTEVHLFSKITAIADVFHAMTSERVYREATPFYLIVKQMQEDAFGKLDPGILFVFLENMLDSLVGKKVELTNGEMGRIILINRYNPIKSLVKSEKGIIDLNLIEDLEIKKIINEIE